MIVEPGSLRVFRPSFHPIPGGPARRSRAGAVRCLLLGALCVPQLAQAQQSVPVTDQTVDDAIRKGVAWIKSQRKDDNWDHLGTEGRFHGGETSLALLALLTAGEDPQQNDMAASLKWLTAQKLVATYVYGIRAAALSHVPSSVYRATLQADTEWLLKNVNPKSGGAAGGYDYEGAEHSGGGNNADNSNSQYGVLGAWLASDAGMQVPETYWSLVQDYWMTGQVSDGGWGYRRNDNRATGSMTAAGLACLFVILDKAYAHDEGAFDGTKSPLCGRHKEAYGVLAAIQRGLDWFGREYTPDNPHGEGNWRYYYLYGVERVGRASGTKYFRQRDWFREGAAWLLSQQQSDGRWEGGDTPLHSTCFAVMFLAHGRAPLLFSKLQHGDDWNNKIRDVAGLTHYAQKRLERLLNWQIVNLGGSLDDLLEAPILYMSGHAAMRFSDDDCAKLREYAQRGGLILGVACCSRDEFAQGFRDLARRLFPQFEMRAVAENSPFFSRELVADIKDPPPLFEVHSGTRALMLLSTKDICAPWNQYRVQRWENYFLLGCNLYAYATDRSAIRSRLQSPDIPVKQTTIKRTITVARIKHAGLWDPEPYGWKRLAAYMNNETGTRLELTEGIPLDSPKLAEYKLAYLTGSGPLELAPAELSALRAYLYSGGTLLADAAIGAPEFATSFENALQGTLGAPLKYLERDSFLFKGGTIPDAVSLDNIAYRRAARRETRGQTLPRLRGFEIGQRLAVIFSPYDVSASLLGTPVYNCRGYEPESALRVARNMLLYGSLSTAEKARAAKSGGGKP